MKDKQDIDYRFSTPICKIELSAFPAHRDGLISFVKALQKSTEGIQSSNYQGWHSERFLHVEPRHPDLKWLVRKIGIETVKTLQAVTESKYGVDVRLRELWANVNEAGGWNVPHVHPVSWAGIVYVKGHGGGEPAGAKVPEKGADRDKAGRPDLEGGDTVFLNPVAIATLFGQGNFSSYRPEPGHMLLFPGYLSHMVVPHAGSEDRITFAFNIDMLKKSRKPSPGPKPIPREHVKPRVNVIV
jgi:hypothetical protein